ncbi:MAG: penicillin-binding protein 2, partial [Rickettsiales bacterium]|nr:penicillin-binding protein 2 [Rickettsiales bacterium]
MRDAELVKVLTRRSLVIAAGEAGIFLMLGARLYQLQIMESGKYKKLSERNSIRIRLIAPARGTITDRNGEVLADNRNSYEIHMIPEDVIARGIPVDETLDAIASKISLGEAEKERVRAKIRAKKPFFPVLVKSYLSWEEMAKIQAQSLDLPGVYVEETKRRNYPAKHVAAHVVGYVASATEDDLRRDADPLLSLPDFKIGKSGIEKALDPELRGRNGESVQIVNAAGRVIDNLDNRKKPAIPGRRATLTIDKRLQEHAAAVIQQESASAVVMDIHTGDILCMASVPSFNPNIFQNEENAAEEFKALVENPRFPFINKAVEGLYAPGSTFKMMTAMAAMADGKLTPATRYECRGHMDYGDARYHCWKSSGHGACNLEHAFEYSCDIFFYNLATKIQMDAIQEMAYRFGLGSATGIEIGNERAGQVPSREWKRNYKSEPWYTGDTIIASIGQGFTLTTPLQLAVMTARIANNGIEVSPHIVRGEHESFAFPQMNVNLQHLELVRRGMFAVVNSKGGTGRSASIDAKGAHMAGKTGTSQVRRITREERLRGELDQNRLPWNQRNHALFVGFAPFKNPRFSV